MMVTVRRTESFFLLQGLVEGGQRRTRRQGVDKLWATLVMEPVVQQTKQGARRQVQKRGLEKGHWLVWQTHRLVWQTYRIYYKVAGDRSRRGALKKAIGWFGKPIGSTLKGSSPNMGVVEFRSW